MPMPLTEAMGCFDCGQLFVTVDKRQAIRKLAAHPWTGTRWRWTGAAWHRFYLAELLNPIGLSLLGVIGILGAGIAVASLPLPSVRLFLGLISGVSILLLLLVLLAFSSFRA